MLFQNTRQNLMLVAGNGRGLNGSHVWIIVHCLKVILHAVKSNGQCNQQIMINTIKMQSR